jgi:hypothetical protein
LLVRFFQFFVEALVFDTQRFDFVNALFEDNIAEKVVLFNG